MSKQLKISIDTSKFNWIHLTQIDYVIRAKELNEKNLHWLIFSLGKALIEISNGRKEISFTGLLFCEQIERSGFDFIRCSIINHLHELTAIVNTEFRDRINTINEGNSLKSSKLNEKIYAGNQLMKKWQFLGEPELCYNKYLPLQVTMVKSSRQISFKTIILGSLRPQDFPTKCKTTSEFLCLVGTTLNSQALLVKDIEWFLSNYKISKFLESVLSDGFNFENIKIKDDNCEEWDYSNPDFDVETGNVNEDVKQAKIHLTINKLIMNKTKVGDIKENSGSVIVGNSGKIKIKDSVQKINDSLGEDVAKVIKQVAVIVEQSQNHEAIQLFSDFKQNLQRKKPNKSKFDEIWKGLTALLPQLGTTADIAEKIATITGFIGK